MEIIVLGSAHGRPLLGRFNTSLAVVTGDDIYLLDCGEPCAARLIQEGLDPQRVRAAIISHMHADHAAGMFMLLQEMQLGGRQTPFALAVPEEAVAPLTAFLPTLYCAPASLGFPLTILPIWPGAVAHSDGQFEVSAYRNSHLRTGPSGELDDRPHSFSFVIGVEGKRVVWTGDLPRTFDELGELLAEPTDLLLSELTHMDPDALFEFLAPYQIGTTLFHHVYEGHFADFSDFGPMLARARQHLSGEVLVARDGDRVNV
jgi:ribonuclease Z